jgi:F/Y-rich N-terminus
MKTLLVAPERRSDKDSENSEPGLCYRVGSLVVHSLGTIESQVDGFHSENYIFPPGYMATRIYWSTQQPLTRTVYVLKVEKSRSRVPVFSIMPSHDPSAKITGRSVSQVYATLMERVRKTNAGLFSQTNEYSNLPVVRRTRKKTFGLNGPQVRPKLLFLIFSLQ